MARCLSVPGTSPNTVETLTINVEWVLDVHQNLFSFLKHLREKEDIDGLLWIDAICINQDDIQERNAQVLRMRDIYSLSRYVIAWLGPERDSSTLALSFIKSPFKVDPQTGIRSASSAKFNYWGDTEMKLLQQGIRSGATIATWEAVTRLFDRAWWKRTWVIQEVLLATELIFMCGHELLDVVSLWTFLENMWAHSSWADEIVPSGLQFQSKSSSGRTLIWLRQTQGRISRDLLQMLYHTRPTQSTDARDKVYGLLGVASDAMTVVSDPNYSLSVIEVHAALFENMTSVRKNLDWLTLVHDHGNDSKFPSWFPDLTTQSTVVSINTSRFMANGSSIGFCAARHSLPDIQFESSIRCVLKGFLIDEVDGLGAKQQAGQMIDSEDELLQPISEANAYQTDQVSNAIWMTLVADQKFEGTEESWRAPAYFGFIYAKQAFTLARKWSLDERFDSRAPEISTLGNWFLTNKDLIFGTRTIESWTSTTNLMHISNLAEDVAAHEFERRLRSTISGEDLSRRLMGIWELLTTVFVEETEYALPLAEGCPWFFGLLMARIRLSENATSTV